MEVKKPCYIWDQSLLDQCDRLPAVPNRASVVHDLLEAYGLIQHLKVIRLTHASYQDLKAFHSELYLDYLKTLVEIDEDYVPNTQDEEYGMGYDCQPLPKIYELVATLAGSSITAAKCLLLGISDVAINWCGGWHHAQRYAAAGFCYVNDIVLAIEKLRLKYNKILYIDLDIHHGNGVQDAYNLSKSVFTLSFHKYEPGFYPGSGGIDDIGIHTGKGYKCNFPLNAYYNDTTLQFAFNEIFPLVYSSYMPDAIVMQCGADALVGDPNGGACLTEHGYISCLCQVLGVKKPTMLLGGGGYNNTNAARLWAKLTAVAAGVELDENIPEHDNWPMYGPDYKLSIQPSLTKDLNTEEYLKECITKIRYNLKFIVDKHNKFLPIKGKVYEMTMDTQRYAVTATNNKNLNTDKSATEEQTACLQKRKTTNLDVYEFHD